MSDKNKQRLAKMSFATLYNLYLQKIEKKGRSVTELNQVIEWLTGIDSIRLQICIDDNMDLEQFFENAMLNENRFQIKGLICGCRVEEMKDSFMQNVRYLDKLVDELAKGKQMHAILRQ
jgi:hypothetical protein